MTIKQQGGIFGRNPTFNDVTVEEIAATTVNTNDLSVSDQATINASISEIPSLTKLQIGNLGTGSDATYSGRIKLDDASTSLQNAGGIEFKTSTFASGYGWKINSIDSSGVHLVIGTRANSADWTEVARFNSSGNLAFPSGQGIDFSATSGTGTSELFDDYEEGTWTPVYSASGLSGITYLAQQATYTKIGRQVAVVGYIATTGTFTSGSSTLTITGLPFTSSSTTTSHVGFANATRWQTAPVSGRIGSSTTSVSIFSVYNNTGTGADPTSITGSAMISTDGGNNNVLQFSAIYFV